jgi:predicted HAD superfamily Cof-like phosphohydrolase
MTNNFLFSSYIYPMEKDLTLAQAIEHVKNFHHAFLLPVRQEPAAHIPEKEMTLRFNLMKEENEEYWEAAKNGDIVEIADALGDMLYILCGTINAHGLQQVMAPVFEEIQRSNMSKLDANGQPIFREDGKVMKSELYFKPNIAKAMGMEG